MMSGLTTVVPLFVGPSGFLIGLLLLIVLVFVIARVLLGFAWKLVVIAAVVLGVLWLVGVIGAGGIAVTPPGLG